MFIFDRLRVQVINEEDETDGSESDWTDLYADSGKRPRSPSGPSSSEPSPKRAAVADDIDEEL